MSDPEIDRLLDITIDAMDFRFMIGDVRDFLAFSEENIAWQHKRELQAIALRATNDEDSWERDQLEQGADHRFQVSLPLRVRYSALLSFVTSVEWSMAYLNRSIRDPVVNRKDGVNFTVRILRELSSRVSVDAQAVVDDFEALVKLRNCVVHAGGIVDSYEHKEDLPAAIAQIPGTTLESWHFFGPQVCFARGALEAPIARTAELVLSLHKTLRERGHQK